METLRPRHLASPSIRGFSLVELMLTSVIVAVVVAIGVPRYANANARFKTEAAAQRVVADLQRAQAHAKANSRSMAVRFDVLTDRVDIPLLTDIDRPGDAYVTLLDEEPYRSGIASADFGGDFIVIFDGYGRPDSGGTVVLRSGRHSRIITLEAETGRASIQ